VTKARIRAKIRAKKRTRIRRNNQIEPTLAAAPYRGGRFIFWRRRRGVWRSKVAAGGGRLTIRSTDGTVNAVTTS
jgi:hypothetical protein